MTDDSDVVGRRVKCHKYWGPEHRLGDRGLPEVRLAEQTRVTQESIHLNQPLSSNINLKAEIQAILSDGGDQEQD